MGQNGLVWCGQTVLGVRVRVFDSSCCFGVILDGFGCVLNGVGQFWSGSDWCWVVF